MFAVIILALAADPADTVTVDAAARTVSIPATVAPRKLEHLKGEVYPIELIAGWPHPKGKKAHETVVVITATPSEVHKALVKVGLTPGKPAKGDGATAEGPGVIVYLDVPAGDGPAKRLTPDKFLMDPKTKKPFPKAVKFKFTGSVMSQESPDKPEKKYGADLSGSLIALFPVTDECVVQSTLTMKEEKYLKLEVNTDAVPKVGTAVTLVLEAAK